jgi:hypothetical protein
LAYALADSPVGLLAWNSQVMGGLEPDVLLAHVTIHWLTGTAGSALRIYADSAGQQAPDRLVHDLLTFSHCTEEDDHQVNKPDRR